MKHPSKPRAFDPHREGERIAEAFTQMEGGAIDAAAAAGRLGITREELRERVLAHRIVTWTDKEGRPQFPVWQFGESGLLPGIEPCLAHLGNDYWGHMKFFLTAAESAGDRSPLELLRDGRIDEALAIAKATKAD